MPVLFLTAAIHFLAACLLIMLMNRASLTPWRRAANAHWTERARLLWPVRFTASLNIFFLPYLLYQFHWYLFPGTSQNWITDGLASFPGAMLGCFPLDRNIRPGLSFRAWLQDAITWWGMRLSLWIGLVVALILMPPEAGGRMVLVAAGYLLFLGLFCWGHFLKLLWLLRILKPAGPRLMQIASQTASQMGGVKVRATWELHGGVANAFVYPTSRELVFSHRTLEICTDEEVAAICAHELAHLQESKFILAGRLFGALTTFPIIFAIPLTQTFGWRGFLGAILLMLMLLRYNRWFSQRMEKRADKAARAGELNEGVYARALEKLYRENLTPAVNVNNRQTHPHLYDRMVAAGITPDFPRPARPKRLTPIGWACVFCFAVFVALPLAWGR